MIRHGDCLDIMPTLDAESIDAIVTDPPYGLEFMGKDWDRLGWQGGGGFSRPGIGDRPTAWASFSATGRHGAANPTCAACGGRLRGKRKCACPEPRWKPIGKRRNPENEGLPDDMTGGGMARHMTAMQDWHYRWAAEALRVAKPGAYLLAFGGTRTVHRLASAIEDAGWEIRDTLVWAYAQGFPKSHNLDGDRRGWGTALKPAWEPIVMARKPLRGTVAANVAEYGTGALNIDACRIGFASDADRNASRPGTTPSSDGARGSMAGALPRVPFDRHGGGEKGTSGFASGYEAGSGFVASTVGRWPANVILTDPIFDGGWDGVVGGGEAGGGFGIRGTMGGSLYDLGMDGHGETVGYGDSGTYSRFFLIPKASRSDREPPGDGSRRVNTHPTVKPTELMRHLVRLVTPQGGTVLDPFLGSGTTALAAEAEGFAWVGIERESEYVAIAEARLTGTQRGLAL